jgi:uncharacterized protein YdiU (UPF0061 family)
MSVATRSLFPFDNSLVRELPALYIAWKPQPAPAPELLLLNDALAVELGLDPHALRSPEGVAVLAGNELPEGAASVALAYAGHQFGNFVPRLGDGRALLLGEVVDVHGNRRDLHFKGSGRTPFARGADGRAAVGPMLREYLTGEAMYGLGIPTTRALAVVATGEDIARETMLPGAVLTRVAASHLRVGTFTYAAGLEDKSVLRALADYAIARHHPAAADDEHPYRAFLRAVIAAQARLVAQWMSVGFVHGVMNTDNVTISGETIDYGPCAFIDVFDPGAVFSSIDATGRYAYRNQAPVMLWNLTRLAEALLPLIDDDPEAAVAAAQADLETYAALFEENWLRIMHAKLAVPAPPPGGDPLGPGLLQDWLGALAGQRADWTRAFRALSAHLRGDDGPMADVFADLMALGDWLTQWHAALAETGVSHAEAADAMDRVNPIYIPRNHLVEEALAAAADGDLQPAKGLVAATSAPYDARPGLERYAGGPPSDFGRYRTFCGT